MSIVKQIKKKYQKSQKKIPNYKTIFFWEVTNSMLSIKLCLAASRADGENQGARASLK